MITMSVIHLYLDGGWSDWEAWGKCSVTCGGGLRTKRRHCDNPAPSSFDRPCIGNDKQKEICNNVPCRGKSCLFMKTASCLRFSFNIII